MYKIFLLLGVFEKMVPHNICQFSDGVTFKGFSYHQICLGSFSPHKTKEKAGYGAMWTRHLLTWSLLSWPHLAVTKSSFSAFLDV